MTLVHPNEPLGFVKHRNHSYDGGTLVGSFRDSSLSMDAKGILLFCGRVALGFAAFALAT